MTIELCRLSLSRRNEVFRDLARSGIYPAAVGDRIKGHGPDGHITATPATGVLIDGRAIATVGSTYGIDQDAHACPACPHPPVGVILSGLPEVLANGRPIAVAGSETHHSTFCGPKSGWVAQGRGEMPGLKQTITLHQAMTLRGKLVRG